jgi:hypothetical protein
MRAARVAALFESEDFPDGICSRAVQLLTKLGLSRLANATVRVSSVLQQHEWASIGFFPAGANLQRLI